MKVVILDAGTLGADLPLTPITESFETVVYTGTASDEVESRIADCDVIIINKIKLNESNLSKTNAKLICITATGYDNIDVAYCRKKGIAVCNVVGYSSASVAQCTAAMALSLSCRLSDYTEYVSNGEYEKSGVANHLVPPFYELEGKTWGIIGLGNIGKRVARIAEGLSMNVLAFKRTPDEKYNCVSLETLCKTADIISIHTPLTNETFHLIGEKQLNLMKKSCILINVARGNVCDEQAVADAVLSGKIAAFGADVYSKEPFGKDHPFTKIKHLKNVCLTPHMTWGAYEARVRCIEEIKQNILSFQHGEKRCRVD